MLQIALSLVSAAAINTSAAPARDPDIGRIRSGAVCQAELDPAFVHFVPEARSSGPNPLFRLISGAQSRELGAIKAARPAACIDALTRTSFGH